MPSLHQAQLRYTQYYISVARQASQQYLESGHALELGLRLFDLERPQIDQSWYWVCQQSPDIARDTLLLDHADATAHIGELRYHPQTERIPMLEQRLGAVNNAH
jgi:hypothetical protein